MFVWRVATRGVGLLSTLILARLLQPADFGLVAIATGFIMAAEALSWIGVQDALAREPDPDRQLYDTAFTLSILRGAASAVLVLLLARPVALRFGDDRLTPILVALACGLVMNGMENIGVVDFRRHLDFRREFRFQVIPRLLSAAVTVGGAVVLRSHWALVLGILTGHGARLLLSYVMSAYRPALDLRSWRRLVGFASWSWVASIIVQLRDRSDHAIIGRMLDTRALGMFAVGYEIGTLTITELAEPLQRALFSGFATVQDQADRRAALFLTMLGGGMTIACPAGIGLSIIADPLVQLLLGDRWAAASEVIRLVAVAGAMSMVSSVAYAFLSATGAIRLWCLVLAASVAVRIPLMIVLVGQQGITGAAMAIAVSMLVEQALGLLLVLPRVGATPGAVAGRLVRPMLASLVMVGVMTQAGLGWGATAGAGAITLLLDVLLRIAVGATAYAAALFVMWWAVGRPPGAERDVLGLLGRKMGWAC